MYRFMIITFLSTFLLIPFGVQKCELKYRKGGGFVSEEEFAPPLHARVSLGLGLARSSNNVSWLADFRENSRECN